jgi:hypothetical protein
MTHKPQIRKFFQTYINKSVISYNGKYRHSSVLKLCIPLLFEIINFE